MNRRHGLIPAALCAWLISGVVVGAPGAAIPVALTASALVALGAGWLVWLPRRGGRLWGDLSIAAVIALAATAATAGIVGARAEARAPAVLSEWASGKRQLVADVTVTSLSAPTEDDSPARNASGNGVRFRGEATTLSRGGDLRRVDFPVLVFAAVDESRTGPPLGSTVRVSGRWQQTELGDRVSALVFSDDVPATTSPASPFVRWAHDLRRSFIALAEPLPGWGGELLPGLSIGDTSAVSVELDAAMTASSLSHLTAVSGANCAIVVMIGFGVGGMLALRRGIRVLLAASLLGAFVVLVTPEPSVIRASAMACAVLVARLAGRPTAGLPVLCTVVVALLISDPWLARDYGFALSVLATAGLLVLTRPLTAVLTRIVPRPVASAFAIPLAAQLACQPVLALLDPSIAVYGVLANLLTGPAAPAATILGLVACLLAPLVPPFALLVACVAWLPAAWIALLAAWFVDAPAARLPLPPGLPAVLLSVAALVLAGGAVMALRGGRRVLAAALAIVLVAASGTYLGTAMQAVYHDAQEPPVDWSIAACDVGQGDAVVLRDGDRYALIDTGDDAELLRDCLSRLGVSRIDLLALTHFDRDHVGAFAEVLGRVGTVIHGPTDGTRDERVIAELRKGGAETREVAEGDTGRLGDGTTWNVLWPPTARSTKPVEPGNDASVVLETSATRSSGGDAGSAVNPSGGGSTPADDLTAVYLGDLGETAQNRLRRAGTVPFDVDVVKVAHHGSRDQSAALYERLNASVALVSVGENDYGHPTSSILDVLRDIGTVALRTDTEGTIAVGARHLSSVSGGPASDGPASDAPASDGPGKQLDVWRAGRRTAAQRRWWRLRWRETEGVTWRQHGQRQAHAAAANRPRKLRSRRCRGTKFDPHRSFLSPVRRASSPIGL